MNDERLRGREREKKRGRGKANERNASGKKSTETDLAGPLGATR